MNCFNKKIIFAQLILQITIMYKKFSLVLIVAAALFAVSPAFSQKKFESFGNLSVGAKLSTLGYGFEVATPLNNLLMLRLGVNLLNLNLWEWSVPISDANGKFMDSFGHIPDYRFTPSADFKHGSLLLDFHLLGGLHLTAGAFVGKSILKVDGRLVNPANNEDSKLLQPDIEKWPYVNVDNNNRIGFTDDGRASMDLQLGNTLKPYLGIGLGRAVPKNRLSFKVEIGAVFQKGYNLRHDGAVFDFKDATEPKLQEIHDYALKYLAIWPMVNFQISCRIF